MPQYNGQPVSNIVRDVRLDPGGGVVLVSQNGCEICTNARNELDAARIKFTEVGPCSPLNRSGCYNAPQSGYSLPVVIVYGPSQRVIFVQMGWGRDLIAKVLVQLKSVFKEAKNHEK